MRKLASIQVVEKLYPIVGADLIEVAQIQGWHVVVKKGEFVVGDKVIYCEIDSVLPPKEEFAFLEKVKYRIKTQKMRGQISQGICFPTTLLTNGDIREIGEDVTDELGVTLYVSPGSGGLGEVNSKGNFPTHLVSKTDEERVHNMPDFLKFNVGRRCYVTEKLDGSSFTAILTDSEFYVCSRNLELKEADPNSNAYWGMVAKYNLQEKMKQYSKNIAVQGEIIGPGIQKNKYKLSNQELYIFNVVEIDTQRYLSVDEMELFCDKNNLKMVPVLDKDIVLSDSVIDWVELAKGKSKLNPNIMREGIVVRNNDDGLRFSFKVINPNFLLKYDE